ncbi:DsrE family protein [Lentibacter algarum]|uniref:DsrE family protein n=1 Tax=Lentibacter algarum TaxID=576131 RepID=UPI001C07B57A|nr:DsrE family protein [Lentibacter algarum]MBU2981313.1 DsrE family protein [Lentibacter algarum]
MLRILTLAAALFGLFFAAPASADIDGLLASDTAPVGVVFEVVEGDESALSWVLPRIERYSKRLRDRFPDVKIAVVTHGSEQFGLTQNFSGPKAQKISRKALQMSSTGTELHVCGGHAAMRDVPASAFPAHINVADSGPEQVRALRAEGYALVQIRK